MPKNKSKKNNFKKYSSSLLTSNSSSSSSSSKKNNNSSHGSDRNQKEQNIIKTENNNRFPSSPSSVATTTKINNNNINNMVVLFPLLASLLLCTIVTIASLTIRKVLYTLDAPPYTDSGFKYLSPDWSGEEYYPLYVNTCYLSIFLAGTIYLILKNPFRWIIVRRMCFLLSLAELIYFIQLAVTRFPDPNPPLHDNPFIFDMFHVLYVTIFLTVQFYEYSSLIRAIYLPMSLFGLWLLIPTHIFYTIDILTACFSVICVFFIYHWYVRNAVAISKRALLIWFEADALNLLLSEDELYHKKLIELAQGDSSSRHSHFTGGSSAAAASSETAATTGSPADLPSLQFYSTGQAEFSVKLEIPKHLNNPLNVLTRTSGGGYRSSVDDISSGGEVAPNPNNRKYQAPATSPESMSNIVITSPSNNNHAATSSDPENDDDQQQLTRNSNNNTKNTKHQRNDSKQRNLMPSSASNEDNTNTISGNNNKGKGTFSHHHRTASGNHWVNEHGFEVAAPSNLFNPYRTPSYLDAKIKADVFQRATERLVRFVRATYNNKQKWIHLWGVAAIGGGLGAAAGFANLGAVQITDVERPIGVPLPRDIIYEYFPKVWDHAADVFVYTLMAVTGLLIAYRRERFTILRRTGTLYFCIMILRVFTVTSTFPVDPSPICKHREHPPGTTCGDLIFSGHTVALLLASLVWSDYFDNSYVRNAFVIVFIWVFCITGLVLVVLSKLHYTRDVLTACVVVISFYHMWQVSVFLRPDVLLRHPWLRWFELDQFIVLEQEGKFNDDDDADAGDQQSTEDNNNKEADDSTTINTTVSLPPANNNNSTKNEGNNDSESSPTPVGGNTILESPTIDTSATK